MWKVDERVFGRRGGEPNWYTGTVKHIDGERCYVIFDDGDDALMEDNSLKRLELHVGERLFARLPVEKDFKPAKVLAWDSDKVQVKWPNGSENWTSFGMIRLQPESAGDVAIQEHLWKEGDRVFGCYHDLFWYPGVVVAVSGDQCHVMFDAGHQAMLPAERVMPLEFNVEDKVFVRWKGGPEFYPGEITEKRDEVIKVLYEDGDEETTSIRLARLQRDEWFPPSEIGDLRTGTRVLACWFDGNWYPGFVFAIDGKRVHTLFDDGDQALLTPERIRKLDIHVGDHLHCRHKAGPAYRPAEVRSVEGEVIQVRYDDGDEETTLARLIRIQSEGGEESGPQSA